MINVNLGDSTELRIVVHVSTHFHNSHVLHTPPLYIPNHQMHILYVHVSHYFLQTKVVK